MSFTQVFWDAITRLKGYNLGIYNAVSNALGLSGVGGMAANWAKHSKDMATVGEQIATAFGTIAASVSAIGLSWDASTAAADPGAGKVRATIAPPTAGSFSLVISTTDAVGQDVSALIADMGASTSSAKARARLVKVGNPAVYVDVSVTGVSGAGSYRIVAVTYLSGPGGFAAGDAVALGWVRIGDKGDTGAAGAQGAGPFYYSTPTAGSPNAQTLAGPLASLSGNPSVEFIGGIVNGAVTRTNLQPYSKQLDKAAWSKGSVTVTADTAAWIDGSVIMDKVKETAVSDYHAIQNIYLTGLSPTQTYTASIYLKAAERGKGRLVFFANGFADGVAATFDLTAGTVAASNIGGGSGAAANIDALTGGIYRVSITGKLGGSNTSGGLYLNVRDDSGADNYMGVSGSGLYAVYGQLEPGSVATPPIDTGATAASVTDGHMTLAVGSTPARPLVDAASKALAPGAIAYGTKYVATYDGSSWRLAGGGGASVNLAATHAAMFSI